jgi:hypothetical protein
MCGCCGSPTEPGANLERFGLFADNTESPFSPLGDKPKPGPLMLPPRYSAAVRMCCVPVYASDDWLQPFRQFALHHIIIHQPQDPLWASRSALAGG